MKKTLKSFEDIESAWSYCREANHPVVVLIGTVRCKLYPSGRMLQDISPYDLDCSPVWTLIKSVNS